MQRLRSMGKKFLEVGEGEIEAKAAIRRFEIGGVLVSLALKTFGGNDGGLGHRRLRAVLDPSERSMRAYTERIENDKDSSIILTDERFVNSLMANAFKGTSIDEYLRERLMPVEGAIPQIRGIEMFGNSIPVGTVGGDLFEYINFEQRYDLEARIQQAQRLSKEFLEPLPPAPRCAMQWMTRCNG